MKKKQQKTRRRISAYASNDNRISRDYLKIISLSLTFLAIFIALIIWLQAFRPIDEYNPNMLSVIRIDTAKSERFIWKNKLLLIDYEQSDKIKRQQRSDISIIYVPSDLSLRSHNLNWAITTYTQYQNLSRRLELKENLFICGCNKFSYDMKTHILKESLLKNTLVTLYFFSDDKNYIIKGKIA